MHPDLLGFKILLSIIFVLSREYKISLFKNQVESIIKPKYPS